MSGPIVPPLEITEVDGSPDGRPITKIIVSNGDLSISGREATIDTSGSGGSPGTPAKSIQYNSDPAGTFTGSSQLLYETAANAGRIEMSSGAVATQPEIRTMTGRGLQISATDADESIRNQIVVFGENDTPDGIALYPATGLYVQVGDSTSTPAQITSRGATANLVLTTNLTEDKAKITLEAGADGDVLVQTDNAGVLQLENTTTDADSVLSIMGNGTGDAKLDLQNASKRVWVLCDENKKLKIQGGSGGNTFILDVSGAATGLTFPDGTTQLTAASSGGAGITLPNIGSTNETMYLISQSPIWGSVDTTATVSLTSGDLGKCMAYPFIAPKTGDLSELIVQVSTADAVVDTCYLAIYSQGSDNLPETLLGYGSMSMASTGASTQTSLSDTVSLTAGEQYWFSINMSATGTAAILQGTSYLDVPNVGIGSTITETGITVYENNMSAYAVPPATFQPSLVYSGFNRPLVAVKYS